MNILIAGATSFIGRAVTDELIAEGNEVYALIRPDSPNAGKLPSYESFHCVDCDMDSFAFLSEKKLPEMDACIDFAWRGAGVNGRMDADTQEKNVRDTLQLIGAAGELSCRRFLFAGSQAEYGVTKERVDKGIMDGNLVNEETVCHPVSEYGKAKLRVLLDGSTLAGMLGMAYIHMRIFSVYGPGDHSSTFVDECLKAAVNGGKADLGLCTHLWNFLYVTDCARAVAALLNATLVTDGEPCIVNVAGTDTRILREFSEEIFKTVQRNGFPEYREQKVREEGTPWLNPDTSKLKKLTGFSEEVSFPEGIRICAEQMGRKGKQQGKVERTDHNQKECGKKTAETAAENGLREKRCIACGARLYEKPLLKMDHMPASAQDIPEKKDLASEKEVTVELCACSGCGLVQLSSAPVSYYRDVIRAGGYTGTMESIRRAQYGEWIRMCGLENKKILEAGCGQGEFLKILAEYPVRVFGMEHKKELVEKARAEGLSVQCGYPETEDDRFENAPFDGFTSFNFLEHQPDPCMYLRAIAKNLTEDGCGLLTVPSFEYILEQKSFYEIIPDHIAYYTKETLRSLMDRCGFDVLKEERINRDTLSVIVKRKRKPDVSGLLQQSDSIKQEVLSLIEKSKQEHKRTAVWGAGHQGFTLCAAAGLAGKIAYIIDSAPFKQGKYAPGSHIPIISPEEALKEPPDTVIIVAPGYTDEIAGILKKRFPGNTAVYVLKTDHLEKYGEEGK